VWSIPLFGKNLNWGQLHFALTIVLETILVWSNTFDCYTAMFGSVGWSYNKIPHT